MNETCQFCRTPVATEEDDGEGTAFSCVLTSQVLFVETADFPFFDEPIYETDIAFYWCNNSCLGRWMARYCALQVMEERAA